MRVIDRVGHRYGRLVVVERVKSRSPKAQWFCRCDCGSAIVAFGDNLQKGNTSSCGCLKQERDISHGMSGTKVYSVWRQMRQRCENPNSDFFPNYGGRGVKVCERWRDFAAFYADMGNPPHRGTLERKDNDGPYAPENCHWASYREQALNKRNNRLLTAFGRTQPIQQWADEYGLPITTLRNRIDRGGWPIERALTEPSRSGRKL